MSDAHLSSRDSEGLKSNILPFPALTYAAPDPRPPSKLRGFIGLIVLVIAAGLIGLTGWSLITL